MNRLTPRRAWLQSTSTTLVVIALVCLAAPAGGLSLWDRGGALAGKAVLGGRPVGIHCADDTVLTADQSGALELWSFDLAAAEGGPS